MDCLILFFELLLELYFKESSQTVLKCLVSLSYERLIFSLVVVVTEGSRCDYC